MAGTWHQPGRVAHARAGLELELPGLERIECVSTIVPQSRPHRGRPNIPQDRGLELKSFHFPSSPREMPTAGVLSGRRAACFSPGFWEMADGEHSTLYNSAPWSCATP